MADIFISYSSKDSEKADQLSELLASSGLSVWIDRQGIVGAEQWATEIVEGIKTCTTFIILLSPNSIESENVLRELSLASEKRKRVLPVDIEQVELPSSFEYPLAGLQRVAITDFDKILHAHHHGVEKIIKKDDRKSLMILPFEDLSPDGGNSWLADGIVSELISALSNVKSIRIADNQATKEFKKYNGQLATYAREMDFRYFVQGDVRKFGDTIKITARLLDIETGDHLWQDSMKGVMDNIFDFQEEVALKVVEGLKVHLAADEKKKLAERGTENVEAYELYMKGREYFGRQTREGFELAAQLSQEAYTVDPNYAIAYAQRASALNALYRTYDRNPNLLDEAEWLCNEAKKRNPECLPVYIPSINVLMHRGHHDKAEELSKEWIALEPSNPLSYFIQGFFYSETGQHTKAIEAFEAGLVFQPDNYHALSILINTCGIAGDLERRTRWSRIALPVVERSLRLNPDDEKKRVWRVLLMHLTGDTAQSVIAARELIDERSHKQIRDGASLYNIAYLFSDLDEKLQALNVFRRAIDAGFVNIKALKTFLHEDGVSSLAGTPEHEEVKQIVEQMEAKANG